MCFSVRMAAMISRAFDFSPPACAKPGLRFGGLSAGLEVRERLLPVLGPDDLRRRRVVPQRFQGKDGVVRVVFDEQDGRRHAPMVGTARCRL